MPFQKGNKLGARKIIDRPLDQDPICFVGYEGTKEKLREIPNWQTKLRDYVERLIDDTGTDSPPP
jgi:hypothetical protein